jgi:hypothetical protein
VTCADAFGRTCAWTEGIVRGRANRSCFSKSRSGVAVLRLMLRHCVECYDTTDRYPVAPYSVKFFSNKGAQLRDRESLKHILNRNLTGILVTSYTIFWEAPCLGSTLLSGFRRQ